MLISVKDAAELLNVSTKTIYRWIAASEIPFIRAGSQYRFSRADLLAWATQYGRMPRPESIHEPDISESNLPSLEEALKDGGIFYRIGGALPEEVIEEVVSVMNVPAGVDREYLYKALSAREKLASTGVGEGVAIPHMRHPLPNADRASLTLAFLSQPVDWNAIDSIPINVVFVLVCPTMRSHLHLLSHLSFVLRDKRWRNLLKKQSARSELLLGIADAERRLFGKQNENSSRRA